MIPSEDTRIIVQDELIGAYAWADRHKLSLHWLPEDLELQVELIQPETGLKFFLQGLFDDYRAMPPAWSFCDKQWTSAEVINHYPKLTQSPYGSPMFIKNNKIPVICVPFNRLAYVRHRGPHSDWGEPLNWLNAGGNHVKAHYLGDMLQMIYRDFLVSRGGME